MPKLDQIRVVISPEVRDQLISGPLSGTQGRGAASWVRGLIIRELEAESAIRAGRTQIDPACFQRGQE